MQRMPGRGIRCRCNNGVLINLQHVQKVENSMVYVNKTPLSISRAKRKVFMEALPEFIRSSCYNPSYRIPLQKQKAEDEYETEEKIKGTYIKRQFHVRGSHGRRGELPDTYVIFICDFDPFEKGKYCYTFKECCKEAPDVDFSGIHPTYQRNPGNGGTICDF